MSVGEYEVGWVSEDVSDDFPDLGIVSLVVKMQQPLRRKMLKDRLRALEEYVSGKVLRELPSRVVTGAYRVFYRQIGLDPDQTPTPVEKLVAHRIVNGKFFDDGLLASALTIAAIETEVPIMALDASVPLGGLGLSTAREGETLGDVQLDERSLTVCDITRPLALVFDDAAPSPFVPPDDCTEIMLYAIRVPGLAPALIGEALWVAAGLLTGDD